MTDSEQRAPGPGDVTVSAPDPNFSSSQGTAGVSVGADDAVAQELIVRYRRRMRRDRVAAVAFPVLSLATIFVAWWGAVNFLDIQRFILPPPGEVLSELRRTVASGYLPEHFRSTLISVILGYGVAVAVGIAGGIVMAISKTVYRLVYPPLVAAQGVPKSALAPLLLIWFGLGLISKVMIAMLIAFFPIVIATFHGLSSVPPEFNNLGKSLGYSRVEMFSKIQFPYALPEIFSGLKIGIALAVVGAIVAEFVAARAGLGYVLIVATSQLNTALIFADLLVLGLMGVVLFAAIDLLERLVVPWHVASGRPVVSA